MDEEEDEVFPLPPAPSDFRKASKGVFEFPPGVNLQPILVHNPMSPLSNGEEPSPMWSVDSGISPMPVLSPTSVSESLNNSEYQEKRFNNSATANSFKQLSSPLSTSSTCKINQPLSNTKKRANRKKRWSWYSMICSLFVCYFCNVAGLVFGPLAVIYNLLAYTDHKFLDYRNVEKKTRIAQCLATLGFILGLLITVTTVVAFLYIYHII